MKKVLIAALFAVVLMSFGSIAMADEAVQSPSPVVMTDTQMDNVVAGGRDLQPPTSALDGRWWPTNYLTVLPNGTYKGQTVGGDYTARPIPGNPHGAEFTY